MTHRQRILAVFDGKGADRVPYFPDLFYWYRVRKHEGRIPERFGGMRLYDIYRELECGICRHVYGDYIKVRHRNTEVKTRVEGTLRTTTISNPAGTVREVRQSTADSSESYFPIEHFVKTPADLKPLEYMMRDQVLEANPDAVVKIGAEIGERGIYTLVQRASPMRKFLTDWAGLEAGIYMLNDYPGEVARLLEAIDAGEDEYTRLTCQTPGRIVILGDNVDRSLLAPPIFRKYQIPYYRKRAAEFHKAGKIVMLHQDGQLQGLLPLMKETGIDVMDGLTPEPAGDFTVEEVREAMTFVGARHAVPALKCWCGVPASLFCDSTATKEILRQSRHIIDVLGGRLALNVADQVPPNADIEKVAAVAQLAIQVGPVNLW
jgi:hypothetical protein